MTHPISYTVSRAFLKLREDDSLRKGRARGVRQDEESWHNKVLKWQADESRNLSYVPAEQKILGNSAAGEPGRRRPAVAGSEQALIDAAPATKVSQGLATVQQFCEAPFQMEQLDRLSKVRFWRNHIPRAFGPVSIQNVMPYIVQQLISAKIVAGFSPQTIYQTRNRPPAIFRYDRSQRSHEGTSPTRSVELICPERTYGAYLGTGRSTGRCDAPVRIGEACALHRKGVNLTDEWSSQILKRCRPTASGGNRGRCLATDQEGRVSRERLLSPQGGANDC